MGKKIEIDELPILELAFSSSYLYTKITGEFIGNDIRGISLK